MTPPLKHTTIDSVHKSNGIKKQMKHTGKTLRREPLDKINAVKNQPSRSWKTQTKMAKNSGKNVVVQGWHKNKIDYTCFGVQTNLHFDYDSDLMSANMMLKLTEEEEELDEETHDTD